MNDIPIPPRRSLLQGVLFASSAAAVVLVAFRCYYSGRWTYSFLVWNLFLAWVPLWLAGAVERLAGTSHRRLAAVVGLLWLLFLPNAPYLMTDLVHLTPAHAPRVRLLPTPLLELSPDAIVPPWFDVMMLVVFAWQGLLLGFVSLYIVQGVIRRRFGMPMSWAAAVAALVMCGVGVSLGRFERWNSWDLFRRPQPLLADVAARLTDPLSHPRTLGTTLLLSGFLLLAYLTIVALTHLPNAQASPREELS